MKKKIPGVSFLEQHPTTQRINKIDSKHVVVDKADWEKTIDYLRIYPWLLDKIQNQEVVFESLIKSPGMFSTKPIDPIRLSRFEVDIVTDILNDEEKSIFREQIVSINETSMKFNQNEVDGKIQPLAILTKLIGNNFDVHVKSHSREGKVLGVFVFQNVYLDGFHGMNLDFSYESKDSMLTVEAWVKVSAIKFNNVKIQ